MSSAEDAIEDLHGLLQAAGEKPPYVLAGYSFGGLLSLLYAGTYPDEVDGIVLVDATLPLEWDLDPPGIAPQVEKELNANAERIDFYGAGATTEAVLDRLPEVPITYMFALQQEPYPKEWKGAYPGALRKFMRDLPEGRLVEYDTTHDMVYIDPGRCRRSDPAGASPCRSLIRVAATPSPRAWCEGAWPSSDPRRPPRA